MRTVEALWIGEKSVQARIGTEVDSFAAIFRRWKILRIGIENTFANRMESLPGFDGEAYSWWLFAHLPTFSAGRNRKADQISSSAI